MQKKTNARTLLLTTTFNNDKYIYVDDNYSRTILIVNNTTSLFDAHLFTIALIHAKVTKVEFIRAIFNSKCNERLYLFLNCITLQVIATIATSTAIPVIIARATTTVLFDSLEVCISV